MADGSFLRNNGTGSPLLKHIVMQLWERHCLTMWPNNDLDRMSARMIYAIWREERLCNVCVLQRVHLSKMCTVMVDTLPRSDLPLGTQLLLWIKTLQNLSNRRGKGWNEAGWIAMFLWWFLFVKALLGLTFETPQLSAATDPPTGGEKRKWNPGHRARIAT